MQEPPQEVCVTGTMTRWAVRVYSPYDDDLKAVVKSCSAIAVISESSSATETFIFPVIKKVGESEYVAEVVIQIHKHASPLTGLSPWVWVCVRLLL